MAIYIGGKQYKLICNGDVCEMQAYSPIPITNNIRLLSSENYILKDMNNVYLTVVKEDE